MHEQKSGAAGLNVVLYGDIILPNEYRLGAKADFPLHVTRIPDNASDAAKEAALMDADAVVCVALDRPCRQAPRLRLVQLQAAGYDKVVFDCLPAQAAVCNAFGHERAIAEYVQMTMLMWTHRWKAVEDSFRGGSWQYSGAMVGPLRDELGGQTVGILGLGQMGLEIAARARAMGTRVLGCSRNRKPSEVLDDFYPLERIDEFLARCDFVVVCIAHVPQTEKLIDVGRLAKMKRSAVLVNVARAGGCRARSLRGIDRRHHGRRGARRLVALSHGRRAAAARLGVCLPRARQRADDAALLRLDRADDGSALGHDRRQPARDRARRVAAQRRQAARRRLSAATSRLPDFR